MQGMKSLFVCVLIVSLASQSLVVRAEAPQSGTPSKPTATEKPAASEKPASTEASKPVTKSAGAELCQCVGQGESSASKRIDDVLASPLHQTGMDYADQPLQDVITQISEEYAIPIQLDRTAMEEAGIGTDSPVTITLHNISVRSGLKLLLRHLQLTWIVQDEVLMITTRAEAGKHFDTCVYNVQGLVDDADPGSVKALVASIYGCVATDTWAANGGQNAEIRGLPSGLLVVSHTPAVQEQVSALLSKIRKMREQAPLVKGQKYLAEPMSDDSSRGGSGRSTNVSHANKSSKEPDKENKEKGGGGSFSVR